ncbi:hypothetical protein X801_06559 [Opisthorchis viverrini]|uniref:Amino acid transporter transmembrane domain-containing protein n=1 Tax=Opisthorchis viverrini TaxID=6198 RepID=A0A1S8WSY3_OPIVI|nr:hypothetical protein X801_06559 [Opisthorchis viverrini]
MLRSRACDFRGHGQLAAVITLINCTMGVVALAMPYCFQQCGVLLSVVSILITGIACTGSCDLLIRLCLTHRVTSFEKTCFRHLGILGKLLTELSIIGLMLGFIVGYNVSLSDLGSGIASKLFINSEPENLRIPILTLFTVIITPLCFLTRVQSLSNLSAFAMLFYCLMILHVSFLDATLQWISSLIRQGIV